MLRGENTQPSPVSQVEPGRGNQLLSQNTDSWGESPLHAA
jgi:hypothetical protein